VFAMPAGLATFYGSAPPRSTAVIAAGPL
jgi:hypothetical protein